MSRQLTRGRRALLGLALVAGLATMATGAEMPTLPQIVRLEDTATSHAFLASAHLARPVDLARHGYVEEEFLVSGRARVFDWPTAQGSVVLGEGPYATRILIRRPRDAGRANGTVVVEALNPSSPVDAPIMWAESFEQFLADGVTWVGVTIKPNTIKALKTFDPARYARAAMPNPLPSPRCAASAINPSSQPTTPEDETGLAWDILAQVGALLKNASPSNPLRSAARRLYMTGQSQTAGYARTFATVFGKTALDRAGKPLYDAYLYSGSPPWQVPLHQCREDLPKGDARLITPAVGVPVVELFAQGDIGTNVETRRPDADSRADRFRRYEIAGAPHVDPWEELSFADTQDMARATRGAPAAGETVCSPKDVEASDFPTRYAFNAAWRNLDRWVRDGVAPPKAPPLTLRADAASDFRPDAAFVEDEYGNAQGGVRTPHVEVPTARWVGAKTGAFRCLFEGYKFSFDAAKLRSIYGTESRYVDKVRDSARRLQRERWLTDGDAREVVAEAQRVRFE